MTPHIRHDFSSSTAERSWALRSLGSLDGVGGWVFTADIEHIFEHRVILMVQEVLL
jgi:hypothetical protein